MRFVPLLAALACRIRDGAPVDPGPVVVEAPPVGMEAVIRRGGEPCADSPADPRLKVVESADWGLVSAERWGLTVGDYDDDGSLDVILPTATGVRSFRGTPRGLEENTTWALPGPPQDPRLVWQAASTGDWDGDGVLDVYVGGGENSLLLRGVGNGQFEVEPTWALEQSRSMGATWADLDADDDLDLVVADYESNTGPGIYENVDGVPVHRPEWVPPGFWSGQTFVVGVFDLDGDHLPEIYKVNDIAGRVGNALLWNQGGGVFVPDAGAVGLDVEICSMGIGVGDMNGDEVPDLALSDCGDLWLFESSAFGPWIDTSASRSFRTYPETGRQVPWGIDLGDLDADGDLDAFVGYGELDAANWDVLPEQPDGVYLQEDGEFVEVSSAWGVDRVASTRGMVLADMDDDGFLDVIEQHLNPTPATFWRSRCDDSAWLRVSLRQDGRNPRAVGAMVRFRDGDRSQVRWILAGGTSIASGGPLEAHAGFGRADKVTVDVVWPDGVVTTHGPMPTRQEVRIDRRLLAR